jgi:hypothetical protein
VKKVIFVGSTPFSGSTFLHMILANDPKGFPTGEARFLAQPRGFHHVNPVCSCGDPNCTIWRDIYRGGPENVYETIFQLQPEVELAPFQERHRGQEYRDLENSPGVCLFL